MRNIFVVNATQVVVSEAHPEGIHSVVDGFPKYYDSKNYNATEANPNGDEEMALRMAKSAYHAQLSNNEANATLTRVMTTVTLMTAAGRIVMSESIGAFPDMTPAPVEPEVGGE